MTQTEFSQREKEVIEHLLKGESNKQIAQNMGISVRTVEFHLSKIYPRLEVHSRAEAIIKLTQRSLEEPASNITSGISGESTVVKEEQRADNEGNQKQRRFPMKSLLIASITTGAILIMLIGLVTSFATAQGDIGAVIGRVTRTPRPSPSDVHLSVSIRGLTNKKDQVVLWSGDNETHLFCAIGCPDRSEFVQAEKSVITVYNGFPITYDQWTVTLRIVPTRLYLKGTIEAQIIYGGESWFCINQADINIKQKGQFAYVASIDPPNEASVISALYPFSCFAPTPTPFGWGDLPGPTPTPLGMEENTPPPTPTSLGTEENTPPPTPTRFKWRKTPRPTSTPWDTPPPTSTPLDVTPILMCTPPPCSSNHFICDNPNGCPGGCGVTCLIPSPTPLPPQETPTPLPLLPVETATPLPIP